MCAKRQVWPCGRAGYSDPLALEGAIKTEEISYIHAKVLPVVQMKHGHIAWVDSQMPVICLCPQRNISQVEAQLLVETLKQDPEVPIILVGESKSEILGLRVHCQKEVSGWDQIFEEALVAPSNSQLLDKNFQKLRQTARRQVISQSFSGEPTQVGAKTDSLVGVDEPPACISRVLDVLVSPRIGLGTLLLVAVREGFLQTGQYFAVGSAFGRILRLYPASGEFREAIPMAPRGSLVYVEGIRSWTTQGSSAADDYLYVFSKARAYWLAEYRKEVENLAELQVGGPPFPKVQWQHDSFLGNPRTQAAFPRAAQDLSLAAQDQEDEPHESIYVCPTGEEWPSGLIPSMFKS